MKLFFNLSSHQRLDAEQLELLLSHPCAPQPLWLIIVCEELRVFGDFGKLTGLISGLPDSLDGLLEEIIRRLIAEGSTQCMEKVGNKCPLIHALHIASKM